MFRVVFGPVTGDKREGGGEELRGWVGARTLAPDHCFRLTPKEDDFLQVILGQDVVSGHDIFQFLWLFKRGIKTHSSHPSGLSSQHAHYRTSQQVGMRVDPDRVCFHLGSAALGCSAWHSH